MQTARAALAGCWFSGCTAAGVLQDECHFGKVAGHRSLTELDATLRAHDAVLDNRRQAA
jgi:hypothetical protein